MRRKEEPKAMFSMDGFPFAATILLQPLTFYNRHLHRLLYRHHYRHRHRYRYFVIVIVIVIAIVIVIVTVNVVVTAIIASC